MKNVFLLSSFALHQLALFQIKYFILRKKILLSKIKRTRHIENEREKAIDSLRASDNETFRPDVTSAVYNIDKTKRISVEKRVRERRQWLEDRGRERMRER